MTYKTDRGSTALWLVVVLALIIGVVGVAMSVGNASQLDRIEDSLGSISAELEGTSDMTIAVEPDTTTTTTVVDGEQATSDDRTPPLLDLETGLVNWAALVAKVDDYKGQWYIDGLNAREPLTGFNWNDVLRWAELPSGIEVRVINAFGKAVNLTDQEIREMAARTVGEEAAAELPIVRHNDKNLMNTSSFGNGEYMETFIDNRDMVRVSLAPVNYEDGVPVSLRVEAGVFIDCGNVWWTAKPTPTTTTVPPKKSTTTSTTLPPETTTTTEATTTTTEGTTTTTVVIKPPKVKNHLVCVVPKKHDKGSWAWQQYNGKAFYLLSREVKRSAPGLELNPPEGKTTYSTEEWGTRGLQVKLYTSWDSADGRVTDVDWISWEGKCGKEFKPPTTTLPQTTTTTKATTTTSEPSTTTTKVTTTTTVEVKPPKVEAWGECDKNGDIAEYVFWVKVIREAPGFVITHPPGEYRFSTELWGTQGMTLDISYEWNSNEGVKRVDLAPSVGKCGKTFEDPITGDPVIPSTTLP